MNEWPTRKLGEIVAEGGGFIRTGPFGSQLHQSDYVDDPNGIPVVMPKDMAQGRVDRSTIARIDQDTADRLSQHLLEDGDIALSRRGDVGRSAWIGPTDLPVLCGTGSIRVHPGIPISVHSDYLRYFVRSRLAIDYLEGQAVGATMPNLNAGIVARMPVPILPLKLQGMAAEVLRSLEDLIENNRRRVEVLEEMARAIYREWFIHFRYPGHENVPLVDSPFGPIPDGWAALRWGDVAVLDYGKALRGYKDKTNGFPVFGTNGQIGWHDDSLFPPGVVVGRKGAYRGIHLASDPCWVIDTAFYLRILDQARLDPLYAFHQLRSVDLNSIDSGSAIPSTTRPAFYAIPLLLPSEYLMRRFGDMAGVTLAERNVLAGSIQALANIRDLLLPKLVTGQIDVSQLDLDALTEAAIA